MTREENVMRKDGTAVVQRRGEQGFTLIEALVAMVILVTGVVAVANLLWAGGESLRYQAMLQRRSLLGV